MKHKRIGQVVGSLEDGDRFANMPPRIDLKEDDSPLAFAMDDLFGKDPTSAVGVNDKWVCPITITGWYYRAKFVKLGGRW
jgi:hypothetical protein